MQIGVSKCTMAREPNSKNTFGRREDSGIIGGEQPGHKAGHCIGSRLHGGLYQSHVPSSLPLRKLHSLKKMARRLTDRGRTTVRELARLLGTMVAAHPAILPAPLHYRHLERAKSRALYRGLTYETEIELDPNIKSDLTWWLNSSSYHNGRPLQIIQWDLTIESDAQMPRRWGGEPVARV